MKTFDEEFPSLKWKKVFLKTFRGCFVDKEDIIKKEILENCLDKQKVREAIEEVRGKHAEWVTGICFDELLKELGL